MTIRRKKNRGFKRRLLLLVLLVLIWFSHKEIGKLWYPFKYQELIYHYAEVNHLDPLLVAALLTPKAILIPEPRPPRGPGASCKLCQTPPIGYPNKLAAVL